MCGSDWWKLSGREAASCANTIFCAIHSFVLFAITRRCFPWTLLPREAHFPLRSLYGCQMSSSNIRCSLSCVIVILITMPPTQHHL